MQKTIRVLAWMLVLALVATPALAGPGNANFLLGGRSIDSGLDDDLEEIEDLQDLEEQPVFGVSVDFQTGDLPFSWFAGFYASAKEEDIELDLGPLGILDSTFTAGLAELSFGLGKVWSNDKTRPFVHGGIAVTSAYLEIELDVSGASDFDGDDQSAGVYGEGGVYWRLGSRFNIGLAARILYGPDYEIEDEGLELDVESDYVQGGLILGWGWD